MSLLRLAYLALAVLGAVVPMRYFLAWFMENGFSIAGMLAAWNANDAATGLVWDLTITAAALTLFTIERR